MKCVHDVTCNHHVVTQERLPGYRLRSVTEKGETLLNQIANLRAEHTPWADRKAKRLEYRMKQQELARLNIESQYALC